MSAFLGEPLLEVRNTRFFPTPDGLVNAVDDLSYTLHRGETFGVVGGIRLQEERLEPRGHGAPEPQDHADLGRSGSEVVTSSAASDEEARGIRGKEIAMIFQDPFACLHPMYRVGDQIVEAIRVHDKVPKKQAEDQDGRPAQPGRNPESRQRDPRLPASDSRAGCGNGR